MPSATFTVRVEAETKKRLEKLAKSTGRSRSYLAAEALKQGDAALSFYSISR